jgi:hypothetical protein
MVAAYCYRQRLRRIPALACGSCGSGTVKGVNRSSPASKGARKGARAFSFKHTSFGQAHVVRLRMDATSIVQATCEQAPRAGAGEFPTVSARG